MLLPEFYTKYSKSPISPLTTRLNGKAGREEGLRGIGILKNPL